MDSLVLWRDIDLYVFISGCFVVSVVSIHSSFYQQLI